MRTLILALLIWPGLALACDGLTIEDAWVREAPPGAAVLAAYMRLRNTGTETVTLHGVSAADFGGAMLHETRIRDGQASMRHIDAITLAPGEQAVLAPGGMHMMLHGPAREFRAGEQTRITLQCDDGETMIVAPVRKATP